MRQRHVLAPALVPAPALVQAPWLVQAPALVQMPALVQALAVKAAQQQPVVALAARHQKMRRSQLQWLL
jgi:hypothetical protein